jgi:hypothetical protein
MSHMRPVEAQESQKILTRGLKMPSMNRTTLARARKIKTRLIQQDVTVAEGKKELGGV